MIHLICERIQKWEEETRYNMTVRKPDTQVQVGATSANISLPTTIIKAIVIAPAVRVT